MKNLAVSLGILLCFCPLLFAFKSYKGTEVWQVDITRESIRDLLANHQIDVLSQTSNHAIIRVEPAMVSVLEKELHMNNVEYSVSDQDLDALIFAEHTWLHRDAKVFNLTDYNTYEEIATYLAEVATRNPYASVSSIGQSVEGRDLWVIKFSLAAGKPSIWIDCGIHAREWLSQSTCVWGVDLLDQQYGTNPNVTALLDAYDVNILPVYNPDGYAYCWSDERLWRKNRQSYPEDECIGTDLNRNYDDHFGGEGTSNDSCSEIYHGPGPTSELETQAVSTKILDLKNNENLKMMFSMHCFSQLWMYPWGWTHDLVADNAEIERVAIVGVDALISVYGTNYTHGSIANAIYIDSGSSTDWSYSVGIIQTHTLELRPDSNIIFGGFVRDASEIDPTGTETWIGMMAAAMAAL